MTARTGMANLISRLRPMIADRWVLRQDTSAGDGSGTVFWLNHKPNASGGTVAVGGVVQGTTAYSWDTVNGKLSLATAPGSGTAVSVEYQSAQFTDDDLQTILDGGRTLIEAQEIRWLSETIDGGDIVYHRAAVGWHDLEEATSGTIYWNVKDSSGVIQSTANYSADYQNGLLRWTADQAGSTYWVTARSYDLYGGAADAWLLKAAALADQFDFRTDNQQFSRSQALAQAQKMEQYYRSRSGQNEQRGAVKTVTWTRSDLNRS